jgi:phosphoribosylglycinamide formyltransferase-1
VTDPEFRVAVLISGNGSNLQAIIDGCAEGRIKGRICCVISNEGGAFGLERARNAGIPTHVLSHRGYSDRAQYDLELADLVARCRADLIVLAGFMRILSGHFVDRFTQRIINLHPSLLPKYKGLDTHARVLEAGDKRHGATVHLVTTELDGGPIIAQQSIEVASDDTAATLQRKVHGVEHELLPQVVGWFAEHRISIDGGAVLIDGKPAAAETRQ